MMCAACVGMPPARCEGSCRCLFSHSRIHHLSRGFIVWLCVVVAGVACVGGAHWRCDFCGGVVRRPQDCVWQLGHDCPCVERRHRPGKRLLRQPALSVLRVCMPRLVCWHGCLGVLLRLWCAWLLGLAAWLCMLPANKLATFDSQFVVRCGVCPGLGGWQDWLDHTRWPWRRLAAALHFSPNSLCGRANNSSHCTA